MMKYHSYGENVVALHLHMLFSAIVGIGIILLIAWAIKNLKKQQLMNWSVVLIIVGLVGGGVSGAMFKDGKSGYVEWDVMMKHMEAVNSRGIENAEGWKEYWMEMKTEKMEEVEEPVEEPAPEEGA